MRFLIIISIGLLPFFAEGKENKVLIIGIDGCRPDALIAANTPSIDHLIENGSFSEVFVTVKTLIVLRWAWGSLFKTEKLVPRLLSLLQPEAGGRVRQCLMPRRTH